MFCCCFTRTPQFFSPVLFRVLLLLLIHHWRYSSLLIVHFTPLFLVIRIPTWLLKFSWASTNSEFYPNYILLLAFARSFPCLPRVLSISEGFFYPQALFTLHSFPIFGAYIIPTCFQQVFPGNREFNLKGSRVSCRGLKHSPSPTVCLNLTTIHKRDVQ